MNSDSDEKMKSEELEQPKDETRQKRKQTSSFRHNFSVKNPEIKQVTPTKSIEGWIIFVTNIHEEAQDEDLREAFSEFGPIKNMHLNIDRKTGFLKGYALIEYSEYSEAENAINIMNGSEILGRALNVGWGFINEPLRELSSKRKQGGIMDIDIKRPKSDKKD
ncbi:RNA-binding protein 8a [Anaeramoeba ignava]|uniref:RNA-binding protein 8a n=1 Tax=Anaeramoeba ignava TaxID=1746090 RepID=A0A9Q0L6U3_ANAIG|nr:RNA-binding protein 8a [Anaeramoeba ignava]